jgi:hypothetical protein
MNMGAPYRAFNLVRERYNQRPCQIATAPRNRNFALNPRVPLNTIINGGQPVIDAEESKTVSEDKRVQDHVRKMLSKLVQLQQQKRVAGRKAS